MAPIKASQESLRIFSSEDFMFLKEFPVLINFLRLICLAISLQVFLFTRLANFLSIMPSLSSGYKLSNFLEMTKPLALLGSHFLVFFGPIINSFIQAENYYRTVQVFEEPKNVEILLELIEKLDKNE